MSWNYRVIEYVEPEDDPWWAIHEVYYDDDGKPIRYTEEPAWAMSLEDMGGSLSWVLDRMRDALSRPVLKESDFGEQNEGTKT